MIRIISLLLFCIILYSCSNSNKRTDCEPIEECNKCLGLDGTYETLIDNALRCFKLNSIGRIRDSCIRLWNYEENSPNSLGTYYLNLFEFEPKRRKPYATYYTLEWRTGKDKQQIVTCIKKISLQPKSGWIVLKKQMDELELNRIDTIPITQQPDDLVTDGELSMMQYVYGNNTITVDLSLHSEFLNSKYKKIRKFTELVKLVKDEFSVNLFADHFGHDLFKIYSN